MSLFHKNMESIFAMGTEGSIVLSNSHFKALFRYKRDLETPYSYPSREPLAIASIKPKPFP